MTVRLGVNIDHVATIRNARGGLHPEPLRAAKIVESSGADLLVAHLREDRRHINDNDIISFIKNIDIPLQLEIANTSEMIDFVIENKPNRICLVPEKRQEITTESGLNLVKNYKSIEKTIKTLNNNNIIFSIFIDPSYEQLKIAKELGVKALELHTGNFAEADNLNEKRYYDELLEISSKANEFGIKVHAGHGLNFIKAKKILSIKQIEELNIGHFIIGEAMFLGIGNVIKSMIDIIKMQEI